jgi:hypothetical protein
MLTTVVRANLSRWIVRASMALAVMAPLHAHAQIVATSFEELRPLLKAGDRIDVTDATGRTTKGRLGDLSASSLEILGPGTAPDGRETLVRRAQLGARDVQRVRREERDSILNGTLIGFAPGATIGTLILFMGAGCDCYTVASRAPIALATIAFAGGIGAGIGAAVDASMFERRVVYFKRSPRSAAAVSVHTLATRSGAGIRISMHLDHLR